MQLHKILEKNLKKKFQILLALKFIVLSISQSITLHFLKSFKYFQNSLKNIKLIDKTFYLRRALIQR